MTEDRAVEVAETFAKNQGWPWLQPVTCRRRYRCLRGHVYVVVSNVDSRGLNVRVVVDANDGTVLRATLLPR